MNREELIEEAARRYPDNRHTNSTPLLAQMKREAFIEGALFEQAHTPTEAHATPVDTSTEHVKNGADSLHVTPTDGEREALARLIDPEAWKEVEPHSAAFYDDPKAQETYEGFFWQSVRERREPSLAAADRVLSARRTVQGEPTDAQAATYEQAAAVARSYSSRPEDIAAHIASILSERAAAATQEGETDE